MALDLISLPDELLFEDVEFVENTPTDNLDLLGFERGFEEQDSFPFNKPSPGHESVASDVTLDSAIADLGSPMGSHSSGEEQSIDVVSGFAEDMNTIDFSDLELMESNDTMLCDYLTGAADSLEASPEHAGSYDIVNAEPVPLQKSAPVQQRTLVETTSNKNVILKVVMPKNLQSKPPVVSMPPRQSVPGKRMPEPYDERVRNKNAIQAKLNREKKKAYIKELEDKVGSLAKENESLKKDSKKFQKERDVLVEEVQYLRNVLANQSKLSSLLKNMNGNVDSVRLSSSYATRKRSADLDHDYNGDVPQPPPAKRGRRPAIATATSALSAGVCLHVVNDSDVSLEFCRHCAKKSAAGNA